MSITKNFLTKKVILVVAVMAVAALSAVFVASSLAQATAQEQQRMMMNFGKGMPQINGSVSLANEASNFINENVNMSFVEASQTAQGQVTNGTVFGGHLGVVQGYLVYTFFVADTANQMGHLVVVDVENGDALYTSEGQPFGSFGHHPLMFGPWAGQGFGDWHGSGKPHWFGGERMWP